MESKLFSEMVRPACEENLESISPENSNKAAGPMPVDTNAGRYHIK
jgi:hypothetical protein